MSQNNENTILAAVKKATGITGSYQDETLQIWIDEAVAFLKNAGVADSSITTGIIARGVLDLWNYGAGDGKFSEYFMMRASQLALHK